MVDPLRQQTTAGALLRGRPSLTGSRMSCPLLHSDSWDQRLPGGCHAWLPWACATDASLGRWALRTLRARTVRASTPSSSLRHPDSKLKGNQLDDPARRKVCHHIGSVAVAMFDLCTGGLSSNCSRKPDEDRMLSAASCILNRLSECFADMVIDVSINDL